ncbi:hypothetical protein EUA93_13155 [Nocardioides oleivorans]|uniref:Uncharacterized protein n=1 Tax=Nocardioides oleivorans TaxID=273676 RepID=A0A4Q2S430_9ACTN|nr:hypothetical protein [Nocardioides oleivorans]RYB95205.1 hypothetical protein EUA93_13155 [Nocardioides oleivorans]
MGVALSDLFGASSAEGPFFLDAPAETSTDIVRTTIDHATKRLTLTVQFRDLVDVDNHSVEFRLFTPRVRYVLSARMSGARTEANLVFVGIRGKGTYHANRDPMQPCRSVRARYDLAADTLTASVPTACIGAQNWVQVAAVATRVKVTPMEDGSANFAGHADDAFRGGLSTESLGRSPKVRRG